jgi:hypothetical protein
LEKKISEWARFITKNVVSVKRTAQIDSDR